MPVIIWNKAALASFVREHKIGICVDSLEDLDAVLSDLTLQQYAEMQKNVAEISQKLQDGEYFSSAVLKAITALKS